jgi:hypothetical protein
MLAVVPAVLLLLGTLGGLGYCRERFDLWRLVALLLSQPQWLLQFLIGCVKCAMDFFALIARGLVSILRYEKMNINSQEILDYLKLYEAD